MYLSRWCPACLEEHEIELLSTSNEWCYYCPKRGVRFNDKHQVLGPGDWPRYDRMAEDGIGL